MAKYDKTYDECKNLSSEQIIIQYELTKTEIEIMKYLYKEQMPKETIVEYIYWKFDCIKTEVSKVLGSLKKKGLIYSVIDMSGWLGTDIQV